MAARCARHPGVSYVPRGEVHADAAQHMTAITMKINGTGRRSRLDGRRRAFQMAIAVAASQNAANQRSTSVMGLASAAQASNMRRPVKASSTTVTMCQVKRTMPAVIEDGPNGVPGKRPLERLGRTHRSP